MGRWYRHGRGGGTVCRGTKVLALIKAPKLCFADTGLLVHLMGFRQAADLPGQVLWRAAWENFVIAETRKRLLARGPLPDVKSLPE